MEKIYGLLGRKLGHSYSVPIHRILGNGAYRLYELEPEELASFLRREDLGAVNVTIPYKKDAMALCDEVSPLAEAIGSVNTVVRRSGRLYGFNTDAAGFMHMITFRGISLKDRKVLILGSGGTSLTAQYCAEQSGASRITVIRHRDNRPEVLEQYTDSQAVINTTPVGMYPGNGESPVDLSIFPDLEAVVDVIYNPIRTALCLQAEALGIPYASGLRMLTWQAAEADARFFDREPRSDLEKAAYESLMRDTQNLVLIGMPGSGKTTVGAILAGMTGREVLEMDALIEERVGFPIPEFFASHGEEAFRRVETEIAAETGKLSGKIIVTGGGVVTRPENYPSLHQNGCLIELLRPVDQLERTRRPLSAGKDSLTVMEKKRRPLYDRFRDGSVSNTGTVQACAEAVWALYQELSVHKEDIL